MTIPASMPARAAYIGDGVTVNFPLPFVYFENTDGTKQIKVALADNDGGNEVILTENTADVLAFFLIEMIEIY